MNNLLKSKIDEYLNFYMLIENQFIPKNIDELDTYKYNIYEYVKSIDYDILDTIMIESLIEFNKRRFNQKMKECIQENEMDIDNLIQTKHLENEWMDEIFKRGSVEQRTDDWYKQAQNMLTASEFNQIIKQGRTRGRIVLSKVNPVIRPEQRPVPSEMMTPFDWGIRFEPVVKQIYEYKYKSIIKEIGRLVHPIDSRIGASPDGIVIDGEKKGRLIEIKCPITRQLKDTIPEEYYMQMQLQMEVTGAELCDYVECRFRSLGGKGNQEGDTILKGTLWRISKGTESEKYIYGMIGSSPEDEPLLEDDEHILEVIPWELIELNEIEVKRDKEWWKSVQPVINEFWKDVELAHKGQFILPESKRQTKQKKEDECMF
jgi:putative phage-type endonuclease